MTRDEPSICRECGRPIDPDHGGTGPSLCEDCFLVRAAAKRSCDPWQHFPAPLMRPRTGGEPLSPRQNLILDLLAEHGPLTLPRLADLAGDTPAGLGPEVAALRQMDLVAVRQGRIVVGPAGADEE